MCVIPIFKQLSHLVPLRGGWLLTPHEMCLFERASLPKPEPVSSLFSVPLPLRLPLSLNPSQNQLSFSASSFFSIQTLSQPVCVSESVQDSICPPLRVCSSLSFTHVSPPEPASFSLQAEICLACTSPPLSLNSPLEPASLRPAPPSYLETCWISVINTLLPSLSAPFSLVFLLLQTASFVSSDSELTPPTDHLTPSSAAHSEPIAV